MLSRTRLPLAALALTLAALAARADDEGPARPFDELYAMKGQALYVRECAGCHGLQGDGQSAAAAFVDPKPRDFTKKKFKLKTTPSGEPPATHDVLRTIERGIPGTSMPSFSFLPEEERKRIAAYVLNLAELLETPEPAAIPDPGTPPPTTPESVAKGKALFEKNCLSCHGAAGKGDGPSAKEQKDDDGNPAKVRDLTLGAFRGGSDRKDLWYRVTTGLDGTPMPSFGSMLSAGDRWAVVDFVKSLGTQAAPASYPKDPLEAGRLVAERHSCRACHVLDDGTGGDVGPNLRVSGQKLHETWIKGFLKAPRALPKVYPWRAQRMPHLALEEAEIGVLARYVGAMGGRSGPPSIPDPSTFPEEKLKLGATIFVTRCSECHTLGEVVKTPAEKQQGPNLINVASRVSYEWARAWILDPKKIDPKTKMTVPGITPDEVDAVRMFVWKASIEAAKKGS